MSGGVVQFEKVLLIMSITDFDQTKIGSILDSIIRLSEGAFEVFKRLCRHIRVFVVTPESVPFLNDCACVYLRCTMYTYKVQ